MFNTISIEQVHGFTRLTLPLMSKHKIPTTPINYSIWYHYVSGGNKDLNDTIDNMIETGETFTEDVSKHLYTQYCCLYEERKLKMLQEGLRQVLVTLFSEVKTLSGNTEKYERILEKSLTLLAKDNMGEMVGKVVDDIIEETKSVISYSKHVQKKLEATTKDLQSIQKRYEESKHQAVLDFLTGIPNRKAFDDRFRLFIADAEKENSDLSMLLIDIDHFKQINDGYGHLVGDEVLKFVAKKIRDLIKGKDFCARFGGEEFVILLPQTSLTGAMTVAENIRDYFDQSQLKSVAKNIKLGKVTMSIGVASFKSGEASKDLINRSDVALYIAKRKGRNQVVNENEITKN